MLIIFRSKYVKPKFFKICPHPTWTEFSVEWDHKKEQCDIRGVTFWFRFKIIGITKVGIEFWLDRFLLKLTFPPGLTVVKKKFKTLYISFWVKLSISYIFLFLWILKSLEIHCLDTIVLARILIVHLLYHSLVLVTVLYYFFQKSTYKLNEWGTEINHYFLF